MNYKKELEKIYKSVMPLYPKDFLDKDIVLYGAGALGKMACSLLKKSGVKPVFVVDKYTKGNIDGIKIITPAKIPDYNKNNSVFLISISTVSYNTIADFLKSVGVKNIIQFYTYAYLKFPNLLSNGWVCDNPTENEKKEIEKVCESLAHDKSSLYHYLQFLWWKISQKEVVFGKYPVLSGKKFFQSPKFPKLDTKEILIDCGCHIGETITDFINATNNNYKKIYAFEPDKKNLKICKKYLNDKRIIYIDKAVSDKNSKSNFQDGLGYASKLSVCGNKKVDTVKIDSLNLSGTIIKFHIEGHELKALKGAKKTILISNPILMVLADHNKDGLYKIAKFLYNLKNYKLYFNLHDYCGNTAVFYAVPKGRLL